MACLRKSARHWFGGIIAVALVLFFSAGPYIVFLKVAERDLTREMAEMQKPAVVDAHEQLLERLLAVDEGDGRRKGSETSLPLPDILSGDALHIVQEYERLFARINRCLGDYPNITPAFRSVYRLIYKSPRLWTQDETQQVREFLAENRDLLSDIRRVVQLDGPACPADFSAGFGIPDVQGSAPVHCAHLLALDALYRSVQGESSDVVEDVVASIRLASAFEKVPINYYQRVSSIVWHMLVSNTLPYCYHPRPAPENVVDALLPHFPAPQDRAAFAIAVEGQLWVTFNRFQNARETGRGLTYHRTLPWHACILGRCYDTPLGRPWAYMDQRAFLENAKGLPGLATKPYYELRSQLLTRKEHVRRLPGTRILARRELDELLRMFVERARKEALIGVAVVGLLVERHCDRYGVFPVDLDALASETGHVLPKDPFTGKPYRYKRSNNGFLLYSLGANGVDDGGYRGHSERGFLLHLDIPWRPKENKQIERVFPQTR